MVDAPSLPSVSAGRWATRAAVVKGLGALSGCEAVASPSAANALLGAGASAWTSVVGRSAGEEGGCVCKASCARPANGLRLCAGSAVNPLAALGVCGPCGSWPALLDAPVTAARLSGWRALEAARGKRRRAARDGPAGTRRPGSRGRSRRSWVRAADADPAALGALCQGGQTVAASGSLGGPCGRSCLSRGAAIGPLPCPGPSQRPVVPAFPARPETEVTNA